MHIQTCPQPGYEEVWEAKDPESGLHSFIAIHNTRRGPALGGVRFWDYPDAEAGLADVLRLARSMTYKAAVADLPFGGGKGVILKPKGEIDRDLLMRKFGEFVDHLQGRYITAKDVGTHAGDMILYRESTPWVTGLPVEAGGAGDPSPLTAYGVLIGIQVSVQEGLGLQDLKGVVVAVQGLGGVGTELAKRLSEEGCEVWGADLKPGILAQLSLKNKIKPILPEQILEIDSDVLAPCAMGQVLNEKNIPHLKTKIVAGGANDQLTQEGRDAALLKDRNILYAPDFVINAGGLIHVALETKGYDPEKARRLVEKIGPTLKEIYSIAKRENLNTHEAAMKLAESRL